MVPGFADDSGNSVHHLQVGIYRDAHVLRISKHIHLILCIKFVRVTHLESCTPGTRQYKIMMVCTGTSQSVPSMSYIWNLAKPWPDIGFFPDIGSPTDTISGYVSRYRGFLLTRYRDMSHVTLYRVPISGTYPISGHHVTDIVNHVPDIGINIVYNIGCPDIGDMISLYRCQYRVPISGVLISGYDSHRYRSQ